MSHLLPPSYQHFIVAAALGCDLSLCDLLLGPGLAREVHGADVIVII